MLLSLCQEFVFRTEYGVLGQDFEPPAEGYYL